MATINVLQAFVLRLENDVEVPFQTGVQEVEDFVADHWYVKANAVPVPGPVLQAPEPVGKGVKSTG